MNNPLTQLIDYFKADPTGDFESGDTLNEDTKKRNWYIFAVVATSVALLYLAVDMYMTSNKKVEATSQPVIDFGSVIDSEFTERDNQSALTTQQNTIDKQQQLIDKLEKSLINMEKNNSANAAKLERSFNSLEQIMTDRIDEQLEKQTPFSTEGQQHNTVIPQQTDSNGNFLGQYTLPPRPNTDSRYEDETYNQGNSIAPSVTHNGIDSVSLNWETPEQNLPKKRTPDNYVPAGSFVTAIVTGGADANAGVNGQGDTVPMTFQTINAGVLPNGAPSRLNNCTIIGAAYGEISSSRGIVRTQRMSCVSGDEIIDIPIEGTVFNYGRNGIRGTAIMKNGKIVQMAGISGILTGLGETGQALSETTSTSALGSTSTISGSDALLNLAGSATASVGSKLADYYIKLAEQYHPIIELNPGNTVNIVFLKGFPLDPVGIAEYEEALANQQQAPQSATAQILNTISNPLMENLPPNIAPANQTTSNFNQQGQQPPINSAFGHTR